MRTVAVLARKEFTDRLRGSWLQVQTACLTLFAVALAYLGSDPIGVVRFGGLPPLLASLISLNVFLIPLLALTLGYDAFCGEREQGTLGLLLSYPVSRRQVFFGKYLGQASALLTALTGSYVATAAVLALDPRLDVHGWAVAWPFLLSSPLLALVWLSVAFLVSALAQQRVQAIAAVVFLWLVAAVAWDLAGLGVLLAVHRGGGAWGAPIQAGLLLNPNDAYRTFNMASISGLSSLWTSAVGGTSPRLALMGAAALLAWMVVPAGIAARVFARFEA